MHSSCGIECAPYTHCTCSNVVHMARGYAVDSVIIVVNTGNAKSGDLGF